MKFLSSPFIFLLLFVGLGQPLAAQTLDHTKVEKTINAYLQGDTVKDFETLKNAFHPDAKMQYISSKSGYTEYNALEVFAVEKGREPEKNRSNHIAYISITGNAAHAKLEITYPNRVVVDYVNLLKIDGEWKIVNKVFSLKPSSN